LLNNLLVVSGGLLVLGSSLSLLLLSLLSASTTSTEGGVEGKVNVLLTVCADQERGNVNDLLSDANVSLSDEDTCVVDGLGVTELEDDGLESSLQKVLDLEGKNEIELVLVLREDSVTVESSHESASLKKSLGVCLVHGKKLSGSTTNVRDGLLYSPYFSLVSQTELSDKLELLVETFLLKRTSGGVVCLGLGNEGFSVRHLAGLLRTISNLITDPSSLTSLDL